MHGCLFTDERQAALGVIQREGIPETSKCPNTVRAKKVTRAFACK